MSDHQNQTEAADGGSALTAELGATTERTKQLSHRQRELLGKAPAEWGKLPGGIGCTNTTLEALERRGLVETRYGEEGGFVYEGHQHFGWQWRKTPND